MFRVFVFLVFIAITVSARVTIDIVEDVDQFKIILSNSGTADVPIAGYRVHATDTTWDSVSSNLEISLSNYKAGDDLNVMGIYGPTIHQLNFKNPVEAVIAAGDTITITYHDNNIESIPEVFNSPFENDVLLNSIILKGYKDGGNAELTEFDSLDIFPPVVKLYFPVYYKQNRGSSLGGRAFDTSGILNIAIFNDSNWIHEDVQGIFVQDEYNLDFSLEFDHDLNYYAPGWIVSFDSCGNGTLLELRSDVSSIESFGSNVSTKRKVSSNGRVIYLNQTSLKCDTRLEMRDMKGRMVYSKNVALGTESIQIPVDSRCISSGLYFVTLRGKSYTETFKLNINR